MTSAHNSHVTQCDIESITCEKKPHRFFDKWQYTFKGSIKLK